MLANYPGTPNRERKPKDYKHLAAIGDLSAPSRRKLGPLEIEDIAILVLSAILVAATIWLATRVL